MKDTTNKKTTSSLTQQDFYKLFILKELKLGDKSVTEMYESINRKFPQKPHSRNYFFAAARHLKSANEIVVAYEEKKYIYYTITSRGTDTYNWYIKSYKERFLQLKQVADRFVYEITGSGNPVPADLLSSRDRTYFSSLISVKDIVRYIILKEAKIHQQGIYLYAILELLESKFGWRSSKAWIHRVAHEMEENEDGPLVLGKWESERRTTRKYQIQERGGSAFNQIAESAKRDVVNAQHFLGDVLKLFEN